MREEGINQDEDIDSGSQNERELNLSKLKQLLSQGKPIPLVMVLLGSFLMYIGMYTSMFNTSFVVDFRTVFVYPLLIQGVLEILMGVVFVVLGYLLYHGKIRYFNST